MKAILTVGVSASGKSVWAREYAKKNKAIITNRDDLRFSLTGASNWGDYKFDKKVENLITDLQLETADLCYKQGKDIIFADTNLNSTYRTILTNALKEIGYEVEIKEFPITLEDAWKRDALRANGVGREIIYKKWQQWLEYTGRKTYTPDKSLPKAIMFDIDGTLAHMNGRSPFEWLKVDTDTPDKIVLQMLWDFQKRGYKIILLSGRYSVCRELTYNWCVNHGIIFNELLMRAENDNRKDTIIKEDLFWSCVAPHYNVECVVDDRPVVVRMWQDIKIPKVIAVGNQNIEF